MTNLFRYTITLRSIAIPKPNGSWAMWLLALCCAGLTYGSMACDSRPTRIVFTSDRDGNLEIYSTEADGQNQENLTRSLEDEFAPRVSPDKKLIAFVSGSGEDGAIEVIDVEGTSRTRLTSNTGKHGSQRWSPTSDRVAYIAEGSDGPFIYTGTSDGSESLQLTSIQGDEVGDWSGDGNSVAFAVYSGEAQGIWVRNPDGVNELRLTETPDYSPVWSPDSKRIAFLSTRDGNAEIYVMQADASEQKRLTKSDADESQISWSPSGRQILFVSERDGNPEVYVTDVDGTDQTRLTFNNVIDDQPIWSPRGRKIAFVSYLDGDAEIFVMNADGENQVRLTNNTAQDTNPSW